MEFPDFTHLRDLSNRPALWLGLMQADALSHAVFYSLDGRPLGAGHSIENWLKTQDVEIPPWAAGHKVSAAMVEDFEFDKRVGTTWAGLVKSSHGPHGMSSGHEGEERAGGGWRDPANFIITSAFVRLLGAGEQFELDVLKSPFYYRPHGHLLGPAEESVEIEVEYDVVREVPRQDPDSKDVKIYSKPALWTWLRKQAENNPERAKIFKRVFEIEVIPPGYKNKDKDQWYEKRNLIAHGREGVQMTFGEFIDVEAFVVKSMIHISEQCREKLKLLL